MVMGDRIRPAAQQGMRWVEQGARSVPGGDNATATVTADQHAVPTQQTGQPADEASEDDAGDSG